MEKVQWKLNQVMCLVNRWMGEHGLELATQKTELVLISGKRIPRIITMQVGTEMIETRKAVKHLGIMIDSKLTYWEHIRKVSDGAAAVTSALSRLMANVNGPRPSKRRLLLSVTQSILLYGSEIWADALKQEVYRKRIAGVQYRGALRNPQSSSRASWIVRLLPPTYSIEHCVVEFHCVPAWLFILASWFGSTSLGCS